MGLFKRLLEKLGLREPPSLSAEEVIAAERRLIEKNLARQFDSKYQAYLDTDYRDFVDNRYGDHVRQHYTYMKPEDYPHKQRPWYGLALSGGGIRSASFAIGVIQALRNRYLVEGKPTLFDKLAYLSTVSGGGYTGAALSWYQKMFGIFPFGEIDSYAGSKHSTAPGNRILSYIRQHGKYLTPAQLGIASLAGSVLLSVIHSVVAYTLLISLTMLFLSVVLTTGALDPLLNFTAINTGSVEALLGDIPQTLFVLEEEHRQVLPHRVEFSVFFLLAATGLTGLFLLTVFGYALSSVFQTLFSRAYCYRVSIQRSLGLLLKGIAASLFFAAVPLAALLIFGATLDFNDQGLYSSMISGLAGILLSIRQFRMNTEAGNEKRSSQGGLTRCLTVVSTLAFIFFIFLAAYILAESIHRLVRGDADSYWPLLFTLAALIIPFFVNINQVSPHKMYRDRLMETFLKAPGVEPTAPLCQRGARANTTTLSDIADATHASPYHLINCNIILNNAVTPRYRGRLGDSFLLSSLYCGSDATRYSDTRHFAGGNMTLASAMSISGAAENPHSGVSGAGSSTNPFMSFILTFLGLRLGYWAYNPSTPLHGLRKIMRPNYFFPGLRSLLNFGHAEDSLMVELSDGGHFDNTGLYELVRRRTPVIILSDGGADPDATFDDFGNAIERIRVDFGISIRFHDPAFDLSGLLPGSSAASSEKSDRMYDDKYQLSQRGFAIGDIVYPDAGEQKAFVGRFVYIKASLTRNLPGDLYAYKLANPSYPNQPTVDQFFDERQFEAYRELGYQLTRQMIANEAAMELLP
ncbi:patatin-like phospholipase family protein [Marinobacterium rhizophilum]|uniref:Patatin-like phospholipase family protein n=1 Tax=Marinobacterium rhizophilum TaxID=420402 RepID=A0ABY5HJX6_9GAMM|nr:patatin-like phospholipase family protein [Marinobacterium rhizophilum]UTW12161.1 patatin-like phospholipase family protein [Marinobacterium rhizophilum]